MWDFLVQKGFLECFRKTSRDTSNRGDNFKLKYSEFNRGEVSRWPQSHLELFAVKLFVVRFERDGCNQGSGRFYRLRIGLLLIYSKSVFW
jgi:hypothetical protein